MSKQLPAELKKKIIDKANEYQWEDNPEAVRSAYIDGATPYATQLVEAQGRIKTLEGGINELITQMETWRQMCVDEMAKAKSLDDVDLGYQLAGRSKAEYDGILPKLKALSTDNKTKGENDDPTRIHRK